MRSLGIYRKPGAPRDQPDKGIQHLTTATDGAVGLDVELGIVDENLYIIVPRNGVIACEETLKHESPSYAPTSFLVTASEPSSIPLQTIISERSSVEEKLTVSSSENPAASAVTRGVEMTSVEVHHNMHEDAPIQHGESLSIEFLEVLPESISATNHITPSLFVLLLFNRIAVS